MEKDKATPVEGHGAELYATVRGICYLASLADSQATISKTEPDSHWPGGAGHGPADTLSEQSNSLAVKQVHGHKGTAAYACVNSAATQRVRGKDSRLVSTALLKRCAAKRSTIRYSKT